ncbi:hypothetical protein [Roseivirga thermotolerans]|uniref:hypothetical protein n=1 Tax=Roseivirga thermotolerans TaxID=1758176 RepID=UPI00273D4A3C|nr:hypothetical protein [Roseivirga thermotolerans]
MNELLDELRDFQNLETAHFYLYTDWEAWEKMSDEERANNSRPLDKEKLNMIRKETGIKHKY